MGCAQSRRSPLVRALHLATRATARGDIDALKALAAQHPEALVAPEPETEWTVLHEAAARGHLAVVQWLVREASADVHAVSWLGHTPFHLAVLHRHYAVASWLVCQAGADIDSTIRKSGETALHTAAHHGDIDTCIFLLLLGASPDIKDSQGKTPEECYGAASRETMHAAFVASGVLPDDVLVEVTPEMTAASSSPSASSSGSSSATSSPDTARTSARVSAASEPSVALAQSPDPSTDPALHPRECFARPALSPSHSLRGLRPRLVYADI